MRRPSFAHNQKEHSLSEIADAITGTVTDMFGEPGGVTEDAAAAAAAPEAEVATEQPTEPAETSWDFEAAGRDLFADTDDTPDFAAEAETDFRTDEDREDVLAPSEFDDEATAELKKQLRAKTKEAEYHQRRHLETARKAWVADVKGQPWAEFLPNADELAAKATSRREFQRVAKQAAKANYTVLKPHYERIAQERARLLEQTKAEARAEAVAAWGKPTVGGAQVPAAADGQPSKDAFDNALRRRDMVGVTKALIEGNQI